MDVAAIQTRLVAARWSLNIDGAPGPKFYAALFGYIGRTGKTQLVVDLGTAAAKHFPKAEINSPRRLAHALAQWAVETGGFKHMEENLDYSARRLTEVWPRRYPTIAAALPYAGHPIALANKSYGGRFGNSGANDGWTFRGRGLTQLTFRDNYAEAGAMIGVDLIADPDIVATPDVGTAVACAYWTSRRINAAADHGEITTIRRLVNGGTNGLAEAEAYFARAATVLQ